MVREVHGHRELLLCQRLRGAGEGTYALPGGKKNPRESVLACVRRELREEIGIDFRHGRPVSLRQTNRHGFPPVTSIGVLATEWVGKPVRREHLAHSDWLWFPLDQLPSPLFFPTQIAVEDYLRGEFSHLSWNDVELDEELPLWEVGSDPTA